MPVAAQRAQLLAALGDQLVFVGRQRSRIRVRSSGFAQTHNLFVHNDFPIDSMIRSH